MASNVPSAFVFKKLLLTLETMRSCAEKGPTPDPELVAIHGELEHDRNYLSRWGFRRGVKADSSCWLGWRNAKALLV